MIRILFISFFLLITLHARENPFFPSLGEKDIPYTSNIDRKIPSLKRATITLPPQARVIQGVTIKYKSLDGSVETKSIELNNVVDWHLPIFISQSYTEGAKTQVSPLKKKKYKKVASIKYVSFYTSSKSLKVVTEDKMMRNFLLVQPHRIVMDFQRDTSMKSYVKSIPKNIFTKVRIGNHDKYYRVVIDLDGYYRYKMKKIPNGYIFNLR